MSRRILLLLVATLLVGGAWYLGGGEPVGVVEAPSDPLSPSPVGLPDPSAPRLDANPDPASDRSLAETPGGTRAGSTRVPVSGPIEVHVVHAEDGSPFPHVQLTFLDRERVRGWREAWSEPRRRSALKASGSRVSSDARGRLELLHTTSGVLTVRLLGFSGELEWDGKPSEHLVLSVETEHNLHVQVVDDSGRPMTGVPVVVIGKGETVLTRLNRRTSLPDGIAEFKRLREVFSWAPAGSSCRVTFGFPCGNPPGVTIDPRHPPAETLRLVLPSVGSISVLVTDERGEPLQEVVNLSLGEIELRNGKRVFRGIATQRVVAGRTSFDRVGVRAPIALRLDGSRERPPVTSEHTGPDLPGQERTIKLAWTERHPILVGQSVHDDGTPLVRRRGRVYLRTAAGLQPAPPFTSDDKGRFRMVVEQPWKQGQRREVVVILVPDSNEPPLDARLDISHALPGGVSEVGRLVFHARPTLVSGIVKDRKGRPLFGAMLRVELVDGPLGEPTAQIAKASDRRGAFTLHGRSEASELRLVVSRRGYQTLTRDGVRPGSVGLEIVLEAGVDGPRKR